MLMEEMDDYKQPSGLPHAECRVMAETSDNRGTVLEVRAEKGLALLASGQNVYMNDWLISFSYSYIPPISKCKQKYDF